MRKLSLNIHELEQAVDFIQDMPDEFDDFSELPTSQYLDLKTGDVLSPMTEDEDDELFGSDDHLQFPADDIGQINGYRIMESFIHTVEDKDLRRKLERAINGKGAFSRFNNIVYNSSKMTADWNWHQSLKLRKWIVDWLKREQIEPEWDGDIFARPPVASRRPALLEGVANFTAAAGQLSGVRQIALLGDLAVEDPYPDNVRVLVEVDSDMALGRLAKIKRKLDAHSLNIANMGAVVLVVDPAKNYLGRICGYRECDPKLHQDCQEQVNGRRYLHNDIDWGQDVMAEIVKPPVQLWPEA